MNRTATLSFNDFIISIGNQFFNIEDDNYMNYQDDLYYESTDRNGINGYVLKIEEKAEDYGGIFRRFLNLFFPIIKSFFSKRSDVLENNQRAEYSVKQNKLSAEAVIQNHVRRKLLEVINEDVDEWLKQSLRKQNRQKLPKDRIPKNYFKTTEAEIPKSGNKTLLRKHVLWVDLLTKTYSLLRFKRSLSL